MDSVRRWFGAKALEPREIYNVDGTKDKLPRSKRDLKGAREIVVMNTPLEYFPTTKMASICEDLHSIVLYSNNLRIISREIRRLSKLKKLTIVGNHIRSVPEALGEVPLVEITIFQSFLAEIPRAIGNITTLTTLAFPANHLLEIPPEIAQLANLESLILYQNKLSSIPPELGALKKLKTLALSHNQLRGIPEASFGMTSLEKLFLDDNEITVISPELCQMKTLQKLTLERNPLQVPPSEIVENLTPDAADLIAFVEELYSSPEGQKQYLANAEANLEDRKKSKEKLKRIGIVNFNTNAKKGIEFLMNAGIITGTPDNIAAFLSKEGHLSKTKIGEYLGDPDLLNLEVLKEYCRLLEFENMEFDEALRHFLEKFRLPGEAQKIDRIMENFAAKYCQDNPGIFESKDTAYVLAFSTIMLHTDAHNPSVKNKMTKEMFIKNSLNIGEDLDEKWLAGIYERIVAKEIKLSGDDSGLSDITIFLLPETRGWLTKMGGKVKTWKRRWFVLSDKCLYYFKTPQDPSPLGIIPLESLLVRRVDEQTYQRENCFEVFSPQSGRIKSCKAGRYGQGLIPGHHSSFVFCGGTPEEVDEWIDFIRNNMERNPFNELIEKKKRQSTELLKMRLRIDSKQSPSPAPSTSKAKPRKKSGWFF